MADTEMSETEDYDKAAIPTAHASNHESGGSDEISVVGLSGRQITIPYNSVITTISESDTAKHTFDLQSLLSETRKIISISIGAERLTGDGVFVTYPNEGAYFNTYQRYKEDNRYIAIKDGTQRLQYNQSTSNDSFDIICFGYIVEI